MATKKEIADYKNKFNHIPKDYLERLAYLFRIYPFTKKDMNSLLEKIEQLKQTEWESVTYIFYMNPKGSHRPKLNTKTFTFYVKDANNYSKLFDEFKDAHSELDFVISTPCFITTKAYFETPKTMSIQEKMAAELELIHHINAPDWDNIAKTYCDMVQDTLISNDSIVCRGEVEKFYSILPRIEVTLKYLTAYDCKYNKKTIENRKSFKENPKTVKNINYII